jgi:hypothetical protein
MTQRERHTPDSGAAAASRPSADRAGVCSLWEDWYQRAAPDQRDQLVALAARQGVLGAHQLPTPAGGAARPLLAALLAGQAGALGPIRPPCPVLFDGALDEAQREAVARALHTPDLALIQGLPGTGKSRVVAEIVTQAAARGERVLVLALNPAALDRVLERLGPHEALCPVRCLGPDEAPDSLPPCVHRLTLPGRARAFREQALPAAARALEEARHACEARQREADLWGRFDDLAARRERLLTQLRALAERRERVAAAVEAELAAPAPGASSSLQIQWAACVRVRDEAFARLDARLTDLRAEGEKVRGEEKQVEAECERLRPLAEARQGRRFWTGAWWRGMFQKELATHLEQLERRQGELREAAARLEQEAEQLTADRSRAEADFQVERRRLAEVETAQRQAELDAEAGPTTAEQKRLDDDWQAACRGLSAPAAPPAEPTPEAVRTARQAWEGQRQQDEQRLAFARQWADAAGEALGALPGRVAASANVVLATTAALASDPHFGDAAGPAFDLLLLEEAQHVTESELQAVARRARRWVLVADPSAIADCGLRIAGPKARIAAGPRSSHSNPQSGAPRPNLFQRLWHQLHTDPRRLPYSWEQRDGRLVCRLRPVPPGQEGFVESESVADRPEVELRIIAVPRAAPQLAEIVFPASVSVPEAKGYVFRELEELPVQSCGAALRWAETAEGVTLHLGESAAGAVAVPLAEGVCELVAPHPAPAERGTPWHTSALQFDRAAGWDRDRAERWALERLGLRDLGRTALLAAPHRTRPGPLAAFLADLLFADSCRPAECGAAEGPAVEFIAVPALERDGARHHGEREPARARGGTATAAPRLRSVRGGAGLEIDLADVRTLETVPADLRAALPRQGLVNYLEALAVVRALEGLVACPDFRDASAAWQRQRAALCQHAGEVCDVPAPRGHCPSVAIVALYPAQAELIRLLVRRSAALAACPVPVEVGIPAAFRQRECLAALVSLTRSHTHRAVTYGEGPHALALALTRAAARLLLFGDPGTLARRSQWQGALDHLDDAAAGRERALAAGLVGYLQGHGPHPRAFRLHESRGV